MKKKAIIINTIAILIVLATLLTILPAGIIVTASTVSSGFCGDDLTWELNNGVLFISGTGRMWDYSYYGNQSPWTDKHVTSVIIDGGVTSIGNEAFYRCNSIKSIDLPNGLTSIGSKAFFRCEKLTAITIPSGVTSIASEAFSNCSGITSIQIPGSVVSLEYNVFYN